MSGRQQGQSAEALRLPQGQSRALQVLGLAAERCLPRRSGPPSRILKEALDRLGHRNGFPGQIAEPEDGCEPEEVAKAIQVLRGAKPETRSFLLDLIMEIAAGQRTLNLALNRYLRLLAEAFTADSSVLQRLFLERTGARFPEPWDPGDPGQWHQREMGGVSPWDDALPPGPPEPGPKAKPGPGADPPRIARIKALALLGLDEGADSAAIKQAFLRISKVHHPDVFAGQGEEAVREAAATFMRIRAAYEFLAQGPRP